MRIAEINILPNGSTGKIMLQIANTARERGFEVRTYTPTRFLRGKKIPPPDIDNHFSWGSRNEAFFHYYVGTLLGRNGLYSHKGTKQLINDLKDFSPDVLHIHNIHMYCINLPLLFKYIKESGVKVVWTLHDCWAFTGHCPHFAIAKCDKWKTECNHCPQPRIYPKMYLDTSKKMHRNKKKWFLGIENMTLVTPSLWLKNKVSQSFLSKYPCCVINNGIDLNVFKPKESDFREKYGISSNTKIILAVAFGWGYQKGLDILIRMAHNLSEDYKLVLVGTDEKVDAQLPNNVLSIRNTDNQEQLAEIYSVADLLVNPTREDTFPTVNIEALACGTPVLTFRTGGSPEIISSETGSVVECDDFDSLLSETVRICKENPYSADKCVFRAKQFDMYNKFNEYVDLYEEVIRK